MVGTGVGRANPTRHSGIRTGTTHKVHRAGPAAATLPLSPPPARATSPALLSPSRRSVTSGSPFPPSSSSLPGPSSSYPYRYPIGQSSSGLPAPVKGARLHAQLRNLPENVKKGFPSRNGKGEGRGGRHCAGMFHDTLFELARLNMSNKSIRSCRLSYEGGEMSQYRKPTHCMITFSRFAENQRCHDTQFSSLD